MGAFLFVLWSAVCVLGTGGLVYYIMRSRMEVRLSRQREDLAVQRAVIETKTEAMEDRILGVEQVARSKAVDEVLKDLRIEERHYVRTQKALFVKRKSVIRQERMFFRNIPLTNWVEQEMPVEEGADVDALMQSMAIFNAELMSPENPLSRPMGPVVDMAPVGRPGTRQFGPSTGRKLLR